MKTNEKKSGNKSCLKYKDIKKLYSPIVIQLLNQIPHSRKYVTGEGFYVRNINPNVHALFKVMCAQKRVTIKTEILRLMESEIRTFFNMDEVNKVQFK